MDQLAENRSAARRTTKYIILEGKNTVRQTKRQIQALERPEKVLVKWKRAARTETKDRLARHSKPDPQHQCRNTVFYKHSSTYR